MFAVLNSPLLETPTDLKSCRDCFCQSINLSEFLNDIPPFTPHNVTNIAYVNFMILLRSIDLILVPKDKMSKLSIFSGISGFEINSNLLPGLTKFLPG